MGGIPGEGLGRRHSARIHGNRERHIDRTAARVTEVAVCTLRNKAAACGRIDGTVVHDRAAGRNRERVTVQINRHARRNIGGECRIADQADRSVAVLRRERNRIVRIVKVVSLTAHRHRRGVRRDQRNRLIGGIAGLIVSAELDVVALDIETAAGVITAVMKVVPVARVVYLHDALVTADRNAMSHRRVRLTGRTEVRVCRRTAGIRRNERRSVS